jgi:opacity protein-like surface antigen
MRTLAALLTAVAMAGAPAIAQAQEPEEFTPVGYEFCGWQDYVNGGWTYENPDDGAFTMAFARDMSCRDARRNVTRMRYSQRPPYVPIRPGYRCTRLANDYEYEQVRCRKRGSRMTFRYATGA